jgi:hypothetical protein
LLEHFQGGLFGGMFVCVQEAPCSFHSVVLLDTPGQATFDSMRLRGLSLCDVAVRFISGLSLLTCSLHAISWGFFVHHPACV